MATCFRSYEETHYDSYQQAGMTGHSRMATLKQPFQKGKPEFEPGKAKGEKQEGQEKPAGEMAQQVKAMDPDKSSTPVSYVAEREELTPPGGPLPQHTVDVHSPAQ